MRNWRRFGAIIFGSLVLAASSPSSLLTPAQADYPYMPSILSFVLISPESVTLTASQEQQFKATGYDQYGAPMTDLHFSWALWDGLGRLSLSTAPNVALYTAPSSILSDQDDTISVTVFGFGSVYGVTGTATIHLLAPSRVLSLVRISPFSVTLGASQTQQFTAQAFDQNNLQITTLSFSWSKNGLGSLSNTGFYTAPATISAESHTTIAAKATYQGVTKSGSAAVRLLPSAGPPPAQRILTSVVVSPASVTLGPSQTKQFYAYGYDQQGKLIDGLSFSWVFVGKTLGRIGHTTGFYTAPATIASASTAIVQAGAIYSGKIASGQARISLTPAPTPPPAQRILTSVTVSPASVTLGPSQTQQFTAEARDQDQREITGSSFSWAKITSGPGTLSASGLYTAPSSISSTAYVTIQATTTYRGVTKSGAAYVTLKPPQRILTSVTVSPASVTLGPSQTQQFTAKAYDQNNIQIANPSFHWGKTGKGTLSTGGLYTAPSGISSTALVTIQATATYGGVTRSGLAVVYLQPSRTLVRVEVSPSAVTLEPGDSQLFTAAGFDQSGVEITGLAFQWTLTGLGSITLSGSGNRRAFYRAPAVLNGIGIATTARLQATASYGGVSRSGAAVVYLRPSQIARELSRVEVTPSFVTLAPGGSQQFTARAFDQFNQEITAGLTLSWSLPIGTPGSINSTTGFYTAPAQVSASFFALVTVQASFGGSTLLGTATLEVRAPTPGVTFGRLEIQPAITSLPINSQVQFAAVAYDIDGNVIVGLSFTWSLSSGVGQISADGLYSSGTAGQAQIQVSTVFQNQTYSTTRSFTVIDPNQPYLAYLTISPQAVTLNPGEVRDFTARAFDQFGNEVTAGSSWSWQVTGSGSGNQFTPNILRFTAGSAGTALITATATWNSLSQSGQASVAVLSADGGLLDGVRIDPNLSILQPNQVSQLAATALPADGQTIDQNQVLFSWRLLQNIGTLSASSGRVVSFTAGSQTGDFSGVIEVTATLGSETATGLASVVIRPIQGQGVLSYVVITAANPSIPINSSTQLTAQGYDVFGNPLSSIAYSWQILSGFGSLSNLSGQVTQLTAGNIASPVTIQVRAAAGGIDVFDLETISIFTSPIVGQLERVVISPNPAYVGAGGNLNFVATSYDAANNILTGVSYAWDLLNTSLGSITSTGLLTAGSTIGTFSDVVRVIAFRNGIQRSAQATLVIQPIVSQPGTLLGSTLALTLEESGSEAREDSTLRFDLVVRNGGAAALTNVQANFNLPLYTRFLSATSNFGTISLTGGQVIWYAGSLMPGESKRAIIKVFVSGLPAGGVKIRGQALLSSDSTSPLTIFSNEIVARRSAPAAGPIYGPGLLPTGLPLWALLGSVLLAGLVALFTLLKRRRRQAVLA